MEEPFKRKYEQWLLEKLITKEKKEYTYDDLKSEISHQVSAIQFKELIDNLHNRYLIRAERHYTPKRPNTFEITEAGITYYNLLLEEESEKEFDKNFKLEDSKLKKTTSDRQTIFMLINISIAAFSVFINVYNSSLKNGNVVNAEKLEMIQDKILNLETRIDSLFSIIAEQESLLQSSEVVLDTASTINK
jgi:hypothetical protein